MVNSLFPQEKERRVVCLPSCRGPSKESFLSIFIIQILYFHFCRFDTPESRSGYLQSISGRFLYGHKHPAVGKRYSFTAEKRFPFLRTEGGRLQPGPLHLLQERCDIPDSVFTSERSGGISGGKLKFSFRGLYLFRYAGGRRSLQVFPAGREQTLQLPVINLDAET